MTDWKFKLMSFYFSDWKFEKCRQIWLLANAYNDERIPDSRFDALLKYTDSIKGKMREAFLG
jgi:hypothetical protein